MRPMLQSFAVSRRFRGAAAAALLALAALPFAARADVVRLAGSRSVRVVSVARHGEQTTLQLLSGGTLTVPTASIRSIDVEPLSAELCAASPYRCQDRAMLLTHRATATANAATAAHPAEPAVRP